jgi:hypothetical protein
MCASGRYERYGTIFEAAAHHFAYTRALAVGRSDIAGEHLDRTIAMTDPLSGPLYAPYRLEAAWFAAWYRYDLETAQSLMERAGKSPKQKEGWDRLRVRAAIALRSGQDEYGKALLARAIKTLPAGATANNIRQQLTTMESIASSITSR